MEQFCLADHVRVCRTLSDTVGLNLERNRYFSLGARETRLLEDLGLIPTGVPAPLPGDDATPASPPAQHLIAALLDARIIERGAGSETPTSADTDRAGPLASAGYELEATISLRWHHALACLAAHAWARHALRTQSLYRIRQTLQRLQLHALRENRAFDDARAIALVSAFRTLRPFVYVARDRCLLHALTLRRFLAFYDLHPSWVIGVRTRPWAAHSWVQSGRLVLDARPDDICEYTPILIV